MDHLTKLRFSTFTQRNSTNRNTSKIYSFHFSMPYFVELTKGTQNPHTTANKRISNPHWRHHANPSKRARSLRLPRQIHTLVSFSRRNTCASMIALRKVRARVMLGCRPEPRCGNAVGLLFVQGFLIMFMIMCKYTKPNENGPAGELPSSHSRKSQLMIMAIRLLDKYSQWCIVKAVNVLWREGFLPGRSWVLETGVTVSSGIVMVVRSEMYI